MNVIMNIGRNKRKGTKYVFPLGKSLHEFYSSSTSLLMNGKHSTWTFISDTNQAIGGYSLFHWGPHVLESIQRISTPELNVNFVLFYSCSTILCNDRCQLNGIINGWIKTSFKHCIALSVEWVGGIYYELWVILVNPIYVRIFIVQIECTDKLWYL